MIIRHKACLVIYVYMHNQPNHVEFLYNGSIAWNNRVSSSLYLYVICDSEVKLSSINSRVMKECVCTPRVFKRTSSHTLCKFVSCGTNASVLRTFTGQWTSASALRTCERQWRCVFALRGNARVCGAISKTHGGILVYFKTHKALNTKQWKALRKHRKLQKTVKASTNNEKRKKNIESVKTNSESFKTKQWIAHTKTEKASNKQWKLVKKTVKAWTTSNNVDHSDLSCMLDVMLGFRFMCRC